MLNLFYFCVTDIFDMSDNEVSKDNHARKGNGKIDTHDERFDTNDTKIEECCEIETDEENIVDVVDKDKHVVEKTLDYFIDENIWDKIGKELKDYDADDMSMLKWKTLDDSVEFYHTYAKVKGFGFEFSKQ